MVAKKCYTLQEVNQAILKAQIKTLDSIGLVAKDHDLSGPDMLKLIERLIEDSHQKLTDVDAGRSIS